ncbi:MAG TPA: helical backbone metal receptor [Polyangiaceae bacterium]|nr:helical backbone metal receptor [Polyangiaceae bacterium]
MNRRAIIGSLGALLFSAGAAIGVSRLAAHQAASGPAGKLVSLTPAITETLLALGAGAQLVAVSDYCQLPPGLALPRVGSSLTPNYEAIARLHPSLILSDDSAGAKQHELAALARCQVLPWLTLGEVVSSITRLGQIVGRPDAGRALAQRLEQRLSQQPPPSAPRALLLLSYDADRPAELWFIKRNSLHGAALGAAGARNAVERDVSGLPRLSVEELLKIDPDSVLILAPGATLEQKRKLVESFSALSPLRAVKEKRIGIVNGNQAVGPGILKLVDALSSVLKKLAEPPTALGFVE